MKDKILKAFDESIRVKQAFLRDNLEIVTQVIDLIVAAFKNGNKLLLFGNGGSAADAQHIAAEFTNRYLLERPPLPALALTTDTSALTAIANDYHLKFLRFDKTKLYTDEYFVDEVHLNEPGTRIYSIQLADSIKSLYPYSN